MVLEKGKYLKINDIQSIAVFGYEENGESTVIGNLIYKEINGIQDNEINRGGALKDQSLELHMPIGYHIEFDTIGNCDKMLMVLVCDNIINRLTKIKTYLMYKFDPKLNDVSANTKYADIYDFRLNLDTKELKIKGETHTIGTIITNYVFNVDPLIECIIYNANHPTMREITIRWRYNDDKIIIKGIDFAINDFNNIKKSFEMYFK
jgi:DNA-directed RNA polymerase subunit L